ncbi:MAG: gliding motility lipoprotein GldH [Bacteroidota bacterium]|nr:gliding motility lipoprotein GldH [Bacteroidota bacterium]
MIKNRAVSIFLIAFMLMFIACDKDKVFEEYGQSFSNYDWGQNQKVEFNPEIIDIETDYELFVLVRHIYGFPYKDINILIKLISPSGKKRLVTISVDIINENNKYFSDCAGDYCDRKKLIFSGFSFEEAGVYTIIFSQNNPIDPLPGIMDIGLMIRKSNL